MKNKKGETRRRGGVSEGWLCPVKGQMNEESVHQPTHLCKPKKSPHSSTPREACTHHALAGLHVLKTVILASAQARGAGGAAVVANVCSVWPLNSSSPWHHVNNGAVVEAERLCVCARLQQLHLG